MPDPKGHEEKGRESGDQKKAFDRRAFIDEMRRLQAELPPSRVDSVALLREDRDR